MISLRNSFVTGQINHDIRFDWICCCGFNDCEYLWPKHALNLCPMVSGSIESLLGFNGSEILWPGGLSISRIYQDLLSLSVIF